VQWLCDVFAWIKSELHDVERSAKRCLEILEAHLSVLRADNYDMIDACVCCIVFSVSLAVQCVVRLRRQSRHCR
jgi:hypothetical protein